MGNTSKSRNIADERRERALSLMAGAELLMPEITVAGSFVP